MEQTYTTAPLSQEEFEALNKEMVALMEKYNCEIGIQSSLQILKRVPDPMPTPYAEPTNPTEDSPKAD